MGTAPRLAAISARHVDLFDAMLAPDFFERAARRGALAAELRLAARPTRATSRTCSTLPALGARAAVPGRPAGAAGHALDGRARRPRLTAHRRDRDRRAAADGRAPGSSAQHGRVAGGAFVVLGLRQARLARADGRLRPRPRLRLRRRRKARAVRRRAPAARRHLLRPARPAAGQRAHRQDRRGRSSTRSTCGCGLRATPARSRASLANFARYQLETAQTWEHAGADPGAGRGRRPGARPRGSRPHLRRPSPGRATAERLAQAVARHARAHLQGARQRQIPGTSSTPAAAWSRLEFLAQYLKLRHAADEPRLLATSTARRRSRRRGEAGLLPADEAQALADALRLYQSAAGRAAALARATASTRRPAPPRLLEALVRAAALARAGRASRRPISPRCRPGSLKARRPCARSSTGSARREPAATRRTGTSGE